MITDDEVVLAFREIMDRPFVPLSSKPTNRLQLFQVFRGIPINQWKDVHPQACSRYLAVFNEYGVIPEYCFDCYKVTVAPNTVVDLFKLLMVFENISLPNNNTRKCMVERREYCAGTYKGFVYCRGRQEGKEVYKLVRKAVSENISPRVLVDLKRGCSEYARVYPSYAKVSASGIGMQYRKEWQVQEEQFDKKYAFLAGGPSDEMDSGGDVNDSLYKPYEIHALKYWLQYAATIGDMTYLKISGAIMQAIPGLQRPPFKAAAPARKKSM